MDAPVQPQADRARSLDISSKNSMSQRQSDAARSRQSSLANKTRIYSALRSRAHMCKAEPYLRRCPTCELPRFSVGRHQLGLQLASITFHADLTHAGRQCAGRLGRPGNRWDHTAPSRTGGTPRLHLVTAIATTSFKQGRGYFKDTAQRGRSCRWACASRFSEKASESHRRSQESCGDLSHHEFPHEVSFVRNVAITWPCFCAKIGVDERPTVTANQLNSECTTQ